MVDLTLLQRLSHSRYDDFKKDLSLPEQRQSAVTYLQCLYDAFCIFLAACIALRSAAILLSNASIDSCLDPAEIHAGLAVVFIAF